jgi:hypothetical protein
MSIGFRLFLLYVIQQRVVIQTYFVGGNYREFQLRSELIQNSVAIITGHLRMLRIFVPVGHDNGEMKRILFRYPITAYYDASIR